MRICILSEYFYPDSTGGTGTVLSKLIRHLKDKDDSLEIDVITSRNQFRGAAGLLKARENWDGIHIMRLKAPAPRQQSIKRRLAANMVFTARALGRLMLVGRRYDLILVVTAPPTLPLATRLFSKMTGVPYLYLVYDLYLDMAVALKMVPPHGRTTETLRRVQKDWFTGAAKVVVLGRCMRDHVAATYGLPPENVGVVPIPANLELIAPQDKKRTEFRRAHQIDGFLVLYAGNFAQYQDFDTLLDAAKLLKDRADIRFAFVGDGAKKAHIAARIAVEKLSNVQMLPFLPESQLSDMLAAADVSLVTLERGIEGLAVPSKFYNILASGRATIACVPPACEVAQVIAEAGCGVQVDQEDAPALARVIASLADDPQTLKRMGQNARRVCEECFSLARVGDKFEQIFKEIIAEQPKNQSATHQRPHTAFSIANSKTKGKGLLR